METPIASLCLGGNPNKWKVKKKWKKKGKKKGKKRKKREG